MLKRYMHKRERYFAMLNDDRVVRPFEWGTELVIKNPNGTDPRKIFEKYSRESIENSDEFFALPASPVEDEHKIVERNEVLLSWKSNVDTSSPKNDTVRARLFSIENKRSAAVILPHWNAREGSYFDLCRTLNRFGITALRLTLPYHEDRMPPEMTRADGLVAPNIGLTLQSVRQAVLDTKAAVRWLKDQGYERIGIVGTSIGSCTAFLAFVHDMQIDAGVFNYVSGYFADVVWKGLSTYHVREALQKEVTLEELRKFWLPVSPMSYIPKLAAQPHRPQRYIYTLYDLTFPLDLSRETMAEFRKANIEHDETVIPCGHYTLGEKPWVYIDGYKIVSFLRKNLK